MPAIGATLALLAATGVIAASFSGKDSACPRRKLLLWAGSVVTCAFLLFYTYASVRTRDRLEWKAALPPREVTLEMTVQAIYKTDNFGNQRGIARVRKAPAIQQYLEGQQLLYKIRGDITAREGATLRVKGLIRRKPLDAAADSFDAWLRRNEIYFDLYRAHILEETAPPSRNATTMLAVRGWMRDRLLEGSDKLLSIRAMVPAMLLGEKQLLSPDDKALFKETGMLHLFAVSGLHVCLVALTLEGLLAAFRLPKAPRILVAQAALIGYIWVIGAPPSAVRAFLMILFHRSASLAGRPSRGLPALAGSAVAVLVYDPRQLFDIGAQLSYGIVAGIMLYGMPLAQLIKEKTQLYEDLPPQNLTLPHKGMLKARDWLADSIATGLGAFLVAMPLSVQYFGNFAPGSLLLNLLMAPFALLSAVASVLTILAAGVALMPGLGWMGTVGVFFNHADWLCAWEMQGIIAAVDQVPFLFHTLKSPAWWTGGAASVTILACMSLKGKPRTLTNKLWLIGPPVTLAMYIALCLILRHPA
jgi:competence protein ComEC